MAACVDNAPASDPGIQLLVDVSAAVIQGQAPEDRAGDYIDVSEGIGRGPTLAFSTRGPRHGRVHVSGSQIEDAFSGAVEISGSLRFGRVLYPRGIGDFDGDGTPDLAVGAPVLPEDPDFEGALYVVPGPIPSGEFDLTPILEGEAGWLIRGAGPAHGLGWPLAGAGDVNGDGLEDVIVGAPAQSSSEPGRTYVVFGGASPGEIDVTELSAAGAGFEIVNDGMANGAVTALDGGGDFNGDGFADILMGAPVHQPEEAMIGRAYLLLGNAGAGDDIDLAAPSSVVAFEGLASRGFFGRHVAFLGDVNGDGLDDVGIGAPQDNTGSVHIIRGNERPTAAPDAPRLSVQGPLGGEFGAGVSAAGDFDGDGLDDFVVGAPAVLGIGAVYIVFGTRGELASDYEMLELRGARQLDLLSVSVAGGHDLTGNGAPDIVVGAQNSDPREDRGILYLVEGGSRTLKTGSHGAPLRVPVGSHPGRPKSANLGTASTAASK